MKEAPRALGVGFQSRPAGWGGLDRVQHIRSEDGVDDES